MQSAIEYSICPSRMKLESKKKPVQKYYIGYQSYRGIPLDYNGNCFYCHHHFTPTTDGCVVVVLIICKCKVHLQVCLLCIGHNVQWLITIVFIRLALNVVHTHTQRACVQTSWPVETLSNWASLTVAYLIHALCACACTVSIFIDVQGICVRVWVRSIYGKSTNRIHQYCIRQMWRVEKHTERNEKKN